MYAILNRNELRKLYKLSESHTFPIRVKVCSEVDGKSRLYDGKEGRVPIALISHLLKLSYLNAPCVSIPFLVKLRNIYPIRVIAMQPMTVEEACRLLDHNQTQLAEALGVSKVAVFQWKKNGALPVAREYQVRDLAAGRVPVSRKQAA